MRVAEPATVLTDYAIALQCIAFMLLLWRGRTLAAQFWSVGFGAIALGAIAGGTFHGIHAELPWQAQAMLWQLTLHTLGIASFAMGLGTVAVSLPRRWQVVWAIALSIKALIFGSLTSAKLDFFYAVADYSSTLILVLALQIFVAMQRPAPSLKWLLASVAISGLAIWGLISGLNLAPYLTPEAVFHLIQMPGLYGLYRAACALSLEKQKSPAKIARD
jgi:hypothetical protein